MARVQNDMWLCSLPAIMVDKDNMLQASAINAWINRCNFGKGFAPVGILYFRWLIVIQMLS